MTRPRTMTSLRTIRAAALLSSTLAAAGLAQAAFDYPTIERVRYVQECMAEHPGTHYEMTSKCVCAVDALMQQLSLDDFVNLSTAAKATTIGGERGGTIRDSEQMQGDARRWRDLQRKAKSGCFINTAPR
jgi:hypothetical protein